VATVAMVKTSFFIGSPFFFSKRPTDGIGFAKCRFSAPA
jgi:hypothetical protein